MKELPRKILTLENEVEARMLSALLDENGIPHILKSYHDSALDGVFQLQKGWGHIEALPEYRDKILNLYHEMLKKK